MSKYNIAVVGADGRVGTEILEILNERNFPIGDLYVVDVKDSAGKRVNYNEDISISILDIETFDFSKVDVALFATSAEISEKYAEKAVSQGAIVIDNSSFFRTDPHIPLIVPEVNISQLEMYKNKGIIANPNCTTIQMLVALAPLHRQYGVKRVVASTYQSVSGAGNLGLEELFEQTKGIFLNDPSTKTKKVFTKPIAFNIIPHIDDFLEDGNTKEEWKLWFETKRILDANIEVSATCVRVPVFIGHAMALNIELENEFDEDELVNLLKEETALSVVNHRADEGYVTPFEAAGDDKVFISRIRRDNTLPHTINMWVVADNLRKGAALNAIQIAEILVNK